MGGTKGDVTQLVVGIGAAVAGKLLVNKAVPTEYQKYAPYALLVGGFLMTRMSNPMAKAAGTGLAIMGGTAAVGTLVPALAGASVRFNNTGRRVSGYNQVSQIGQAGFPRPSSIGQSFPRPSTLGNVAAMQAAGAFDN